jgi:hypothetical protein
VPSDAGVNWWYFPEACLDELKIKEFCDTESPTFRRSASGQVCLYVGVASELRERTEWHADQALSQSALNSGFLSTFRKSLLALKWIEYSTGFDEINRFMDRLEIAWQTTADLPSAKQIEAAEIDGEFHFPINLQGNRREELQRYLRYLKQRRKEYKTEFCH